MFLQVLGKHLNAKEERSEFDDAYEYARASLLHYARWMIEHAYPSLEKPEKLYFPTETWPAQVLRMSDALHLAALHANGTERHQFAERAQTFFRTSIQTLKRMPTRTFARPVVILSTSGHVGAWTLAYPLAPSRAADDPLRISDNRRYLFRNATAPCDGSSSLPVSVPRVCSGWLDTYCSDDGRPRLSAAQDGVSPRE